VQIDSQSLSRHYASLSDEELIALDRTELTAVAQKYFDAEYARRELNRPRGAESFAGPDNADAEGDGDGDGEDSQVAFGAGEDPARDDPTGEDPDWLSEAACAASFSTTPGQPLAEDADNALAALQSAGIPCQIEVNEINPPRDAPQPYLEYRVMVPGALNLQATSVLDREIFNSGLEAEWRTHLAALSNRELRALNPDVICGGLRDRIERLTKAYNDEVAGRREKRP